MYFPSSLRCFLDQILPVPFSPPADKGGITYGHPHQSVPSPIYRLYFCQTHNHPFFYSKGVTALGFLFFLLQYRRRLTSEGVVSSCWMRPERCQRKPPFSNPHHKVGSPILSDRPLSGMFAFLRSFPKKSYFGFNTYLPLRNFFQSQRNAPPPRLTTLSFDRFSPDELTFLGRSMDSSSVRPFGASSPAGASLLAMEFPFVGTFWSTPPT